MAAHPLKRRDVLIVGGAGLGALGLGSGCVFLRGGAVHPVYQHSAASLKDGVLRIPLSDLASLPVGEVLEIKPGSGFADLLLTPMGDGSFRLITAKCPHRGCVVDFLPAQRQWECPCHDSKFALEGEVREGPAKKPLTVPPSRQEGGALVISLG